MNRRLPCAGISANWTCSAVALLAVCALPTSVAAQDTNECPWGQRPGDKGCVQVDANGCFDAMTKKRGECLPRALPICTDKTFAYGGGCLAITACKDGSQHLPGLGCVNKSDDDPKLQAFQKLLRARGQRFVKLAQQLLGTLDANDAKLRAAVWDGLATYHLASDETTKAKKAFSTVLAATGDRQTDHAIAELRARAKFYLAEYELIAWNAEHTFGKGRVVDKSSMTGLVQGTARVESAFRPPEKPPTTWAVASAYRLGVLYRRMADKLLTAPPPRELDKGKPELLETYRDVLDKQMSAVEAKAIGALQWARREGLRRSVHPDWIRRIESELTALGAPFERR